MSSPSIAPIAPAASPRARRFTFDQRYVAPIFITLILVVGQLGFGILESLPRTLLAIGVSLLTEIVLGRLFTGKIPHLASAYITGISVGILLRSSADYWPYALCSMISITSKYAIRVGGRHIWNPSNLGIVAMIVLAQDSVATLSQQWGNSHWPVLVIWALGSIIVGRLGRFHICATYVAAFVAFALMRAGLTLSLGGDGAFFSRFLDEVAPITGPMYQLFIFFMITDPKTTVSTKRGQMLVAFCVALAEMILRLAHNVHAPYFALFLVGPAANLLEIWGNKRDTQRQAPSLA